MKLGHKSHLNTRNKFSKRFSPNLKKFLPILNELKKYRFWGNWETSSKLRELEP
jgi:hypothetical protein